MWGIKTISMKSKNRLHGSCTQVPQLLEVDLVDHGHCHEGQISHEVGHVGHQNDQHEEQIQVT